MVTSSLSVPYDYHLLDAELSQEIDRRTIDTMGIDGFTLMEIAGESAAKNIMSAYSDFNHGVYLCGKGNNGGDALVVARYLLQHDIRATVVFLSGSKDLSPDALKNLELLQQFDTNNQLTVINSWDDFEPSTDFDFIVDGMLGTGLDSDLRGNYPKAVTWSNRQSSPIIAVDIPTGLHADSGLIMGQAIQADQTFAFGGHKQGFYLNSGPHLTGEITYCELPFPNQYKDNCQTFLLDDSWVPLSDPSPGQHKYDSGVLYIIAGSEGLTGAAMMAAESAWAEGLGAVILICPKGTLPIYEQRLPSIIKKPVGSRDDYFFTDQHTAEVQDIIQQKEGNVLLGPGLGRDKLTVSFVNAFLSQNNRDTIIDADGLWALSQLSSWQKPKDVHWILTPHPGELQRLTETSVSDDAERLAIIRRFTKEHQITLLSKGMPGIIGTPKGHCYLTNYNTRYFARAGSGDVLAGKVSAFTALGYSPSRSCAMGLLRGKQKLDHFLTHHQGLPEPTDFI
ncbi:MAG: NAD(P)H-hydrate dehydratase [Fodinibius sp.]|nr:NAD(P)H-hydrate dehydratase [Fodinibius sp.]